MLSVKSIDFSDRFWSLIDATGDCWLWLGHKDKDGYAASARRKPSRVHRWMYQNLVDVQLGSLQLDHLCRVRHCVNPDHLEPVVARVNTMRGYGPAGINARKGHCSKGHAYTEDNTYNTSDGKRNCRSCNRDYNRNKRRLKVRGLWPTN